MSDYKFYHVDGGGQFAAGEWFDADGDDEAIAFVRAKKLNSNSEIWFGDRLVAVLPAHSRRKWWRF